MGAHIRTSSAVNFTADYDSDNPRRTTIAGIARRSKLWEVDRELLKRLASVLWRQRHRY